MIIMITRGWTKIYKLHDVQHKLAIKSNIKQDET